MLNRKTQKIMKMLLLGIFFAIPLSMVFYSLEYYNKTSQEVINNINPEGKVAGDKNTIINLSDEIPVIPNSDIMSVDRSNDRISMTISTNKNKEEIESFYDDYFYVNGWKKVEMHKYSKGPKIMELDFNDNIIKIELSLSI